MEDDVLMDTFNEFFLTSSLEPNWVHYNDLTTTEVEIIDSYRGNYFRLGLKFRFKMIICPGLNHRTWGHMGKLWKIISMGLFQGKCCPDCSGLTIN